MDDDDDDDDREKTYNWNCCTVVVEVNADDKDKSIDDVGDKHDELDDISLNDEDENVLVEQQSHED